MFLSKLLSLFRRTRPSPEPAVTLMPTVAFDSRRVTASVRADILSTLKSAGDIPKGKLFAIDKAAVASVKRGCDLGMLHSAIMSAGVDGMTKWRASEITRHVHNRASSIMTAEQQLQIGVEEAEWVYSGAFCYTVNDAVTAEQLALDAAHKAAKGQRYLVGEGLSIAGKRTWPGREMGCKCVSRSVIKGFS